MSLYKKDRKKYLIFDKKEKLTCVHCGKPVEPHELTQVFGESFHRKCFISKDK